MNHKRPPIPVIVILVLVIITGAYFLINSLVTTRDGALTASGTIEAVEVILSPELGGKVVEVMVEEGAPVKAGDVLFRLDAAMLQAQRDVAAATLDLAAAAASTAEAALGTSQASYDLALASARLEAASTRTSDWTTTFDSSTTRSEELIAASNEVQNALAERDNLLERLSRLLSVPEASNFVVAEARLLDWQAAIAVAEDVLQRSRLSTSIELRDAAQAAYDAAVLNLQAAQEAYDSLKDSDAAQAIVDTRISLAITQERYDSAQDRLLSLQTSVDSLRVRAAAAALRQAEAAAEQAQLAVAQAAASLALNDTQLAKLTVTAPVDGVILTRAIQPGEVVSPGARAFTLGLLDDLTITVYVPEDRYGELSLGQSATVSVDSFPGQTFSAVVLHIAGQAEFTPRNVQTVEGRSSTVYAIRLQVEDPAGQLKPGMPADVIFH